MFLKVFYSLFISVTFFQIERYMIYQCGCHPLFDAAYIFMHFEFPPQLSIFLVLMYHEMICFHCDFRRASLMFGHRWQEVERLRAERNVVANKMKGKLEPSVRQTLVEEGQGFCTGYLQCEPTLCSITQIEMRNLMTHKMKLSCVMCLFLLQGRN